MATWRCHACPHHICRETAGVNIVLVYNPKSGSALDANTLRQKCDAVGITIDNLIAIDDTLKAQLAPHIEKAAIIGVIGGDGTVSAVAGLVAGTKATLLPLPGGTLNHFTKDLGIAQNIDDALKHAVTSKSKTVDIARVNDIRFINNSSIGLYPSTLRERKEIEPKIGKWTAAVVASLRALVRLKTYLVTIDGKTFHTPFIFVGNNHYSIDAPGGVERSSLDQGELTVFVAKTRSRLVLLKIAIFALIGKAKELDEFDTFHPKTLTVSTKKSTLSVSHDGEVSRLSSPLDYHVESHALRIIA